MHLQTRIFQSRRFAGFFSDFGITTRTGRHQECTMTCIAEDDEKENQDRMKKSARFPFSSVEPGP
jgi:hypothetical protein